MNEALTLGMHALALVFVAAAVAASLGALMARSLFALGAYLAAAGALAATVVLMLGAGEGALGLALFAAAWAPVLLLAGMLLSARSAKAARGGRSWFSMLAAAIVAAALVWPLGELTDASARVGAAAATRGLGFWITPLIVATAAACIGLLGYGERGPLGRERGG